MTLETQFNLKTNPNYARYLRENSNWYKLLNRDPSSFKNFVEEFKEKNNLRPTDRIAKALQTIELFQNVITTIR